MTDLVDRLLSPPAAKRPAIAAMVPHGRYHGEAARVAGRLFSRIHLPLSPVLLSSSHTGFEGIGIMKQGAWETPLGTVAIEEGLADLLCRRIPGCEESAAVFEDEHAHEVQLPFLQRAGRVRRFVPLLIGPLAKEKLKEVGWGIARALAEWAREPLLVASGHLSRYEPSKKAARQDRKLLERLTAMDSEGFRDLVERQGGSTCGAHAVSAVLVAAASLGAKKGELVSYEQQLTGEGSSRKASGYAGIFWE